jgi:thiol-disulfide isomerase/thioredoxin
MPARHHSSGRKLVRLCLLAIFVLGSGSVSLRVQTALPTALSFNDLSGKSHSLTDYRGKIVVLNFWATWCLPCREEMPMLSKLASGYADKEVVFLAVSIDDAQSQPKIPRFLEKTKIALPVFTGATTATLS